MTSFGLEGNHGQYIDHGQYIFRNACIPIQEDESIKGSLATYLTCVFAIWVESPLTIRGAQ